MPTQRYKPEQIVTVLRQIEAAMANGKSTPPGLQGGWDPYADVLSVAEGVWRPEGGAGQTAKGVGEGKHPVETTGSRAVAGEAGVKGCSGGKLLSPERWRCAAERANHVWSYDFVNARTHDGRLLRILALIDEYTRECLALRVARRLNSQDVIETLSEVMLWRGIPEHIRSDNGPEFVARQLREECLNGEIFYSLKEARIVIEQWRQQYNRVPRPQMIM